MQGFSKLMTEYSELSREREKEPKRFNALKSLNWITVPDKSFTKQKFCS